MNINTKLTKVNSSKVPAIALRLLISSLFSLVLSYASFNLSFNESIALCKVSFVSLISFLKIESLLFECFLHTVSRFEIALLSSCDFSLNVSLPTFLSIVSFSSFLAFSKFFDSVLRISFLVELIKSVSSFFNAESASSTYVLLAAF